MNIGFGGTATAGTDYGPTVGGSAVSNLVTFPADQTQLTINPAVDGAYDDAIVEGTEYATLAIGSGTGYTASSMSSGSAAIYDNDVAPPTVSVQATDGSAWEQGPDQGVFTISRGGSTSAALPVTFTLPSTGVSVNEKTRADAANDPYHYF